ncbi:MAG: phosphosulfolactate synthase [Bacillota bacterium]
MKNGWGLDIDFPLQNRETKPRDKGLTMAIDKGLGLNQIKDLMGVASSHIDFLKLAFGTSALYPNEILKQKIEVVKSKGIDIYPGGTFFEIAISQGKEEEYLTKAKELGFSCVEISDGTIDLNKEKRGRLVQKAISIGFKVFTEVGKKSPDKPFNVGQMIELINKDLENGAFKVIIEGRESGKVGVYDEQGNLEKDSFERLLKGTTDSNDIMWETPLKKQQVYMINNLGNNVNLGNIDPKNILALEALRNGLRGDTFSTVLAKNKKLNIE